MQKHKTILILCLAAMLLMIGVGMIVALLPQRVFAVSGRLESVSLVAAVFAMAYLATQLPVGLLSDRFGAKPLLVLGYALCGIAGLVFFGAQSADAIYFGRLIQGIGEAPIWALGPAILSLAYPLSKGRAIGIYNAMIHAGLTLGPLLGLMVAPAALSKLPFLLFAALCFAGGLLILVFLPRAIRADRRQPGAPWRVRQVLLLPGRVRFMTVLSGVLLYGACYGAFVSVIPISLAIANAFDARAISILFIVFYAAIGISQLVAGPMSDHLGRDGLMRCGLLLAALGFAAFPALPGLWAFGPLTLASLGLGVFCVASIAALTDSVPAGLKGTISGGYYLAWALGYVLGPLGIGYASSVSPGLGYHLLAAALFAQFWAIRR